jgi:uncharacterized protein with HEPN domain
MRDTTERLRDIQEAITHITRYTNQGRQVFDQDELVQTWVIHHLEIIGEAARSIPQDFKDLHPKVPWKQISRMRNVLIHIYFRIDRNIIWDMVEYDLPSLKASIDAILNPDETEKEDINP